MAFKEEETRRDYRKRAELGRILVKEEVQTRIKLVTNILRKNESDRTPEEEQLLGQCPDVVEEVLKRLQKRATQRERTKEIEDPPVSLEGKCKKLATIIKQSKFAVVYTGAGISTAASIPDYRGPNGVWTMLQKGKSIESCELIAAEPTITHMALSQLHSKHMILHVVSQNCDGLHLRSGLPRGFLSEVHGNMMIEVCKGCKPPREYIRLFDVTEKTSLRRHKTGRQCTKCGHDLVDTIVHFGERGTLKSPLNWSKAIKAAEKCDLILCLGSSLKVLRKYNCLWGMDRPPAERPKLCIVNLQWTPKDHLATLKINGRCDDVMIRVMRHLNLDIPLYNKKQDPLFHLATPLKESELDSTLKKQLDIPEGLTQRRPTTRQGTHLKKDGDLEEDPRGHRTHLLSSPHSESVDQKPSSLSTAMQAISHLERDHCYAQRCDNMTLPKNIGKIHNVDSSASQESIATRVATKALKSDLKMNDKITCSNTASHSKEDDVNDINNLTDDQEGLPRSLTGSAQPGWFGKGYRKFVKRKRRR